MFFARCGRDAHADERSPWARSRGPRRGRYSPRLRPRPAPGSRRTGTNRRGPTRGASHGVSGRGTAQRAPVARAGLRVDLTTRAPGDDRALLATQAQPEVIQRVIGAGVPAKQHIERAGVALHHDLREAALVLAHRVGDRLVPGLDNLGPLRGAGQLRRADPLHTQERLGTLVLPEAVLDRERQHRDLALGAGAGRNRSHAGARDLVAHIAELALRGDPQRAAVLPLEPVEHVSRHPRQRTRVVGRTRRCRVCA